MSVATDFPPAYVNPRPGVLKTLGICNIIFSVLGVLCIGWSLMMYLAIAAASPPKAEVKVATPTTPTPAKGAGVPMVASFNPFMGFEDENFRRFSIVENGWSLLVNSLMFATGIGLVNRKGWAVRGWKALAWVRIVSVVLIWGIYIVAVAPGFSETMARDVAAQFAAQGLPANRVPQVSALMRIYSIMNLILALGAMVVTSIYPAISIWLLGRPGVRAAIIDKPAPELELP